MPIHRNSRDLSTLLLLGVALAACERAPTTSAAAAEPHIQALVAMGFDPADMADAGDYVRVQGDMLFSKSLLAASAPAGAARGGVPGPRFQYHATPLPAASWAMEIKLNLTQLSAAWAQPVRDAMAAWNGISPSTAIHFVDGGSTGVLVHSSCQAQLADRGSAPLPVNGVPGHFVWFNDCLQETLSPAQRRRVAAHELGHHLGLLHNNWQSMNENPSSYQHVTGTATGYESGSPMNVEAGTAPDFTGFTAGDRAAAEQMYPLPPMSAVSVVNSGGHPLLSWSAVPGAVSYTVRRSKFTYFSVSLLGTTTGTSFLDQANTYSTTACSGLPSKYNYMVDAVFPNGNYSRRQVPAPIAVC